MHGKLSDHHEEFVRLWNNEGTLVKDIAEHFKVSTGYVSQYAKLHREECPKRYGREKEVLVDKKARKNKVNREAFAELWKTGMPIRMMAKHFGVCKQYISKYAKKYEANCPKRKRGTRKVVDGTVVLKLWREGLSIRKIAKILGVTHTCISNRLRDDYGVVITNPIKKVQFEEFKMMWNGGIKAEEIASRFGITKGYVYTYAGMHKGMGLNRKAYKE